MTTRLERLKAEAERATAAVAAEEAWEPRLKAVQAAWDDGRQPDDAEAESELARRLSGADEAADVL